ncbi:enoyl-CoA hydratase/isomerase family protein [Palleronia caenipelagi]|uniref:3-hydroxyisobutyryl-CoA hydrolase n=1 Tax=Palleronia caenipelagi TaxID=2489174 RepID=A0A547PXX1_9RHOB|nr:enoyl-CoA hydratase/isomerase family protein [Palleronia caenipelagi]TRD18964.1 enoyl-CoA hydratase/isomerase family protein [Palleronia caenipelagi]
MSDLSIRIEGRAGRITLTRPKALNALSHEMALEIHATLDRWQSDNRVALILIDAEGDKAFCAGGDITRIHAEGVAGNYAPTRQFWRDEYRLNVALATSAKPVVTLLHGFTMGGGVGVGCHAQLRIADESTRIAMPECGIGLVPDAGGSFILSRAPGRRGEYLGITGHRMDAAEAIHAGFADLFIPRDDWPALTEALVSEGQIEIARRFARDPGAKPLADGAAMIDRVFSARTMTELNERLDRETDPLAEAARKALSRISPLSGAISLRLIREVRQVATLREAVTLEYRCTHRLIDEGDLIEGIRAQVIDKDRQPCWRHTGFDQITEAEIDRFFQPPDGGDLT